MSPSQLYTVGVPTTSAASDICLAAKNTFNPTCGFRSYIVEEWSEAASGQWAYVVANGDSELEQRFERLSRAWKRETVHMSFEQQMVLHPAYQEIIGLGPRAVRLILEELRDDPDFWFWALRSLTGEDPVNEAMRGDLEAMTQVWLGWGRERGYL